MSTDRVSFYDESLKKTIEGDFVSDGKKIHVTSVYGAKSASYGDLGASIDHNAQVLLAQKLLGELAGGGGQQKPGQQQQQQGGGQQKDDQQRQQPNPMKKPVQGGSSEGSGGSQGGAGTSP